MFEAHEEVQKQQRSMENKEQQVQQLQAVLHHERQMREQQQQELDRLRQQLYERQADAPNSAAAAKHRSSMPQLPLQQMLAAQAAEAEAAAAMPSSRNRSRASTTGGAEEAGYSGSPASISRTMGRQRVDMTPPRDQDESLMVSDGSELKQGLTV